MQKLARRVRRGGIILFAAGIAAFGLAAPAVAEPTAPPAVASENCTDPIDGAVVCFIFTPGETPTESTVTATVRMEEGRTLEGALVVVESFPGPDNNWLPGAVATGQNVGEVSATQPYGRGTGTYRANASWVDDQSHLHTGVTVEW